MGDLVDPDPEIPLDEEIDDNKEVADSIDWVAKGCLNPIRN